MPALQSGSHVGPYEILSLLGAGGMGEVYRSRDTKLKREVAIKALPAEFSRDPDRIQRFQREAEVLATLNHPHIAQIYGFENAGEVSCLVLELVEGETLADRMKRGSIPVEEALEFARQIAEALEAAHERGIVHRDLKPANVKITPNGSVKVLDFGLAKAAAGDEPDARLSHSPTLVSGTMPGMILGTAQYMSPEQAKGRAADARSDIWALGCVLYEMLTGKPAFAGESIVEILSAVLRAGPDWDALPPGTPPAIRALLKRCLEKDRNRRMRDVADARYRIEEAREETAAVTPALMPARPSRERLWWSAAIVAGIVLSILATSYWRRSPDPQEMRVQIVSPPGTSLISSAISPDGRKLLFWATKEGKIQLWLRQIESESAEPLPGTENATYPFWSPDSQSVAFFADGQLKRIDLADRIARRLANAPLARGGTWSADGTILFSPSTSQPLHRVPAGGGEAVAVTRLDPPRQSDHRFPHFLPDGRRFLLYVLGTPETQGIYWGSLESTETRRLFDADSAAVFVPPDHIVFARQRALFAQRLDLEKLETIGDAFPLADLVSFDNPNKAFLAVSASAAGTLAYQKYVRERQLLWLDRSGQRIGSIGGVDAGQPQWIRISPDGRSVALRREINGNVDVWLVDATRGVPQNLTSLPTAEAMPVWSPDGSQIAFTSTPKGIQDIFVKPVRQSGDAMLLWESSEHKYLWDWSPDGRFLLYSSLNAKNGHDLWVLPLFGDRKPQPLVQMTSDQHAGRFSPDGRWIAYQSGESGRDEIVMRPFPGPGTPTAISTSGGTSPQWRRDGRELFYLGPDNRVMAVPLMLNAAKVDVGTPAALFPLRPQSEFEVWPDGQRFLVNTPTEDVSSITLIINWKPTAR